MSRMLRKKQADNAFLGFVHRVEEKEDMAEKLEQGAVPLWREELSEEIKAVLNDYSDIFP